MSKITAEHLDRSAFVYIRQSSAYQVANNLESQRRQYGLVERARLLGWESVEVVDEDLGKSGGGGMERPASRNCWQRFARVVSVRFFPWRYHVSPATGEIGTRCRSSAVWWPR